MVWSENQSLGGGVNPTQIRSTQAREAVLRENRIKFNQSMIETVFEPGEIVRFFNHAVHVRIRTGTQQLLVSKVQCGTHARCGRSQGA